MRRAGFVALCCALTAVMLAGASIASAEISTPTGSPVPAKEVEVTAPRGAVVTAAGTVLHDPSLTESLETQGALEAQSAEGAQPSPSSVPGVASPQVGIACVANYICVYWAPEYAVGPPLYVSCGYAGNVGMGEAGKSARNRCGNKTNWLRVNGTAISCMDPGWERPNPGGFNQVYVAAEYGAFC